MFFIPLPLVLLEVLIFTSWVHFYNFWDVFLCYLFPSFIGAVIFSQMGRSLLISLQSGLAQGRLPGDKILHRGAILMGSILLIIPLFLSRILALFLILPILRHGMIFVFKTFIFKRLGRFRPMQTFQGGAEFRHERDAEVVDVTPIEVTHTPGKSEDSSEN